MQPTILWTNRNCLRFIQAVHNPQNDRIWCKNLLKLIFLILLDAFTVEELKNTIEKITVNN